MFDGMEVLIAGDFLPKYRIQELIDIRNFTFMDAIVPIVKSADYSIVNLECPTIDGFAQSIEKGGPCHKTTTFTVDAIRYVGFNCVTLANNHFRDFGDAGCCETLKALQEKKLDYVGGGMTLFDAQKVLYKQIDNKILSIVNICENEFSIATKTRAGSAPLDAIDNYNQIMEARRNSDYVLVIVHGGHEHYQLPSPRMKKLYRHFVSLGADAVVNHHQHCYSGYEIFNGRPIVYGLGNLCFDSVKKRKDSWYEGYMITIDFYNNCHFELHPYYQCKIDPSIELMYGENLENFNKSIRVLNDTILDEERLAIEFDKMAKSKERTIRLLFGSYHNRYLNGAASRGLLPILATKKDIRENGSFIRCESHLDIVQHIIFKD